MSIFYKSYRIGRNGKPFVFYKFRTLKNGSDINSFAGKSQYTRCGKFLRKTKLDELPQVWNVIKGDMRFFGYRPEEERHFDVLPDPVKEILEKEKPGIIDLSSLHFYDEEGLMQIGDAHQTYWEKIRPLKLTLQMFYIENRSWLLNLAIVWLYLRKASRSLIKRQSKIL